MVRPMGHLNVMSPPLVITEARGRFRGGNAGDSAIRQVTDDLVREGSPDRLRLGRAAG